jgi:caffeoyl-CoA O-methyltransferase
MAGIIDERIEQYARHHTSPESPLLQELAQETYAVMAHPGMQIGHLQGSFLRLLVRISGARRILEIGTFTGYSALAMAEGLPEDGKLITCDQDPEAAAVAQRYWKRSPHGSKIELRLGPALETIKGQAGPFDLVFIDADKENNRNYWEAVMPLLPPGGLILVDNVLMSARVLEPQSEVDRAVAEFNAFVRDDPRVEAVLLPIRDGLTVARKR